MLDFRSFQALVLREFLPRVSAMTLLLLVRPRSLGPLFLLELFIGRVNEQESVKGKSDGVLACFSSSHLLQRCSDENRGLRLLGGTSRAEREPKTKDATTRPCLTS